MDLRPKNREIGRRRVALPTLCKMLVRQNDSCGYVSHRMCDKGHVVSLVECRS